jgi:hypothetical protein
MAYGSSDSVEFVEQGLVGIRRQQVTFVTARLQAHDPAFAVWVAIDDFGIVRQGFIDRDDPKLP